MRTGGVRRLLPFLLAATTVVVVTVVALASGAPGTRAQVDDPNDTKGTLDVRRVWFDLQAGPPRWTVLTFADWEPSQIPERGFVFVFLDTAGDPRDDYYVLISSDGRRLVGSLWHDLKHGADVRMRALAVTRDSRSSVVVQVPIGALLGPFRTSYGWRVVTTFTGPVCRATCVDQIPDDGAFQQPVGTPTPTPTDTPTPSPSPAEGTDR
jgi:hypothetical protein